MGWRLGSRCAWADDDTLGHAIGLPLGAMDRLTLTLLTDPAVRVHVAVRGAVRGVGVAAALGLALGIAVGLAEGVAVPDGQALARAVRVPLAETDSRSTGSSSWY